MLPNTAPTAPGMEQGTRYSRQIRAYGQSPWQHVLLLADGKSWVCSCDDVSTHYQKVWEEIYNGAFEDTIMQTRLVDKKAKSLGHVLSCWSAYGPAVIPCVMQLCGNFK